MSVLQKRVARTKLRYLRLYFVVSFKLQHFVLNKMMHKYEEKPFASIKTTNSNVKEHLSFCQSTETKINDITVYDGANPHHIDVFNVKHVLTV
jgi:hypothetical protein